MAALFVMLLTHAPWSATTTGEMRDIMAYFALVILHVVMVSIASRPGATITDPKV